MSFFRKDYSQHPQPVVVKSDRCEGDDSITHDVKVQVNSALSSGSRSEGEASPSNLVPSGSTTDVKAAMKHEDQTQERQDRQQGDDQSTHTNTHDSNTIPQQQDTTKLADGIMSLLGPVVQEMDFNIVSVRKSQTELEKEIERLMAELQLFMASSACPPEVEPAVQKLVKARRQIMSANSTLKSVQDRVDRMQARIEKK